jgi:hypothetical protein
LDSELSEDDSTESTDDEIWPDVSEEILDQDISSNEALPDPIPKRRKVQVVNSILQWLLYFILIWQGVCHLSDNGLAWLLRFLLQFLKVLNIHVTGELLTELIAIFPTSLYMVRQLLDLDRDNFNKYVVCPKCSACYEYNECVRDVDGRHVVKRCSSKHYSRGKMHFCNGQLVKKVTLKNNVIKYYPIYTYCYSSVVNALEKLLKKPGFPAKCEEWRTRHTESEQLTDMFDGQLWKDFQKYNGVDFLNAPRNYGLMLNFDFFQPMKHRKDYSVGVLYLVLLNLPRAERFKWENVLVVGIIPAMGKEPKNLNPFLKPLVEELKALWKGVRLQSSLSSISLIFRAALLCTSSDIPASRKLCGFKGHSAVLGCSRCLKKFPGGFGEKRDYSGFEEENWQKRKNEEHRRQAKKMSQCKTKKEEAKLSRKYGINYYSELLKLEYFDVVRFCSIDPMHNLFLGTAKFIFKHWVREGILNKKDLETLESRIDGLEVPVDIGRLPKVISSNYGSYTAEQWKNWTLIYSLYALKDVLPEKDFKCWQSYVLACTYLCKPILSNDDIIKAHFLLLKFGKVCQNLYGNHFCTPNMHLHCHLKDILKDFGPIHSFWCFSFERYNGILGSFTTNNRSIELQLMRKLTTRRFLDNMTLDKNLQPYFDDVVTIAGNDSKTIYSTFALNELLSFFNSDVMAPLKSINWSNISAVNLPLCYKEKSLDNDDLAVLLKVYNTMFSPGKYIISEQLSRTIRKYGTIEIFNQQFGSKLAYRSKRSTGVLAGWPGLDGEIDETCNGMSFGMIEFYFSHSLNFSGEFIKCYFACVTWHKSVDDTNFNSVNPLHVASKDDKLPTGASRFLPVQRISRKCAIAIEENEHMDKRYILSPLPRHFVS